MERETGSTAFAREREREGATGMAAENETGSLVDVGQIRGAGSRWTWTTRDSLSTSPALV